MTEKYSPEVKERAVPMVMEHQGEYASQWASDRVDRYEDWL